MPKDRALFFCFNYLRPTFLTILRKGGSAQREKGEQKGTEPSEGHRTPRLAGDRNEVEIIDITNASRRPLFQHHHPDDLLALF